MLEKQAALRSKIKSALAYPVAVLSLVLLIVTAIILFIVPVFKGIYPSLHGYSSITNSHIDPYIRHRC